ncbi:hypothetical protein H6F67_25440 [Microcoleus sp. FACHB-1515]|uniref:GDSL-type esterase/lipase family protein n=1 Tax=Cyanophyceae TaxID=3028117 RepID=UPI001687BF2F|nr:GDSL-type esterase/lipase family protein [Microcoleus sp. FACHB-1515]MBD2093192.1 hypothetical protein [Microcoleus sp. FACHB-1515]
MSDFCLLAASLITQGQTPGWKLATPRSPVVVTPQQRCQPIEVATAAVQSPESIPAVSRATALRPTNTSRPALPGLDPAGSAYLPMPAIVRPASGSQLFVQRLAALRSGRLYTRLPVSSYAETWRNATRQPTYEQWVSLLRSEAGAIARGQGSNRLTVLLGDSLYLWYPPEQMTRDRLWLNQGISGDTTAGVLRRLSAFSQTRPDRIQVMVGINDLRRGASDAEVLTNLRQIMRQLRANHPQAQIVVQSILPTRLASLPATRIYRLNGQIAALAQQERVSFLDLQTSFADSSGNLRTELTTDGLHLSQSGYAVWQQAIGSV